MAEQTDIDRLRELTGVSATEYEFNSTTYWTDVQIGVVLDRNTPEVTDAEPDPVPDMAASAADVLEAWAAQLTRSYDITIDGQSLSRSQVLKNVKMLAEEYRSDSGTTGGPGTVQTEAGW